MGISGADEVGFKGITLPSVINFGKFWAKTRGGMALLLKIL
jgi:hypothetical protein